MLIRFLRAAADVEAPVQIIYHGGRQPGSIRWILPLDALDDACIARDLTDGGTDKTFRLDRLALAPYGSPAPIYDPATNEPEDPAETAGRIRCYYAAVLGEARMNEDGGRRQDIIAARAAAGEPLRLVAGRDDDGQPDSFRVYLASGECVGCLDPAHAATMQSDLARGHQFLALIDRVTGGTPEKALRGLVLHMIQRRHDATDEEFRRVIERVQARLKAGGVPR